MDHTTDIGSMTPRTWSELIPVASRIRMATLVLLTLVIYGPTLRHALIGRWMDDPNWSHGWLIPAFSAYLLASRRQELFQVERRPHYGGAAVMLLALAGLFHFSWIQPFIYPRGVSLIVLILGLTLLLGGWPLIRITWFPICFLLLAVPLPERVYVALTMPQQQLASRAAAVIMPMIIPGLYTESQGVVIDYVMLNRPAGRLNVEEACSGMRLMMAFVTLGVATAYLGQRPLWQRLVMIACCLPIAVICNIIRVTVTGVLFVLGRDELAQGVPHQILGLLMLIIALGLYSLVGFVLSRILVEDESGGPDSPSSVG